MPCYRNARDTTGCQFRGILIGCEGCPFLQHLSHTQVVSGDDEEKLLAGNVLHRLGIDVNLFRLFAVQKAAMSFRSYRTMSLLALYHRASR